MEFFKFLKLLDSAGEGFLSFPQFFEFVFDKRVALIAGLISTLGYLGFTSSQILAGAKLAAFALNGFTIDNALFAMGVMAIVYTVMGGFNPGIRKLRVETASKKAVLLTYRNSLLKQVRDRLERCCASFRKVLVLLHFQS